MDYGGRVSGPKAGLEQKRVAIRWRQWKPRLLVSTKKVQYGTVGGVD